MDGTDSHSVRLEFVQEELEKTWQESAGAVAEFDAIIEDASVLLAPDGPLRIRQAGRRMTEAVNAHNQAVKRYVDLVTQRAMKFGAD